MNLGRSAWTIPAFLAAAAVALAPIAHASPRRVPRAAATPKANLATFAGTWIGHTRGLTITRGGHAKESIGDGCCDRVVDLHLQLSHPRGTAQIASVGVRVTSVRVHDPSAYSRSHPAPRVGETGRLKLRYGVITDAVTQATYCDEAAQAKSRCGA